MNGRKPGVNPIVFAVAGLRIIFGIGLIAAGPLLAVGLVVFVLFVSIGIRIIVSRTEPGGTE